MKQWSFSYNDLPIKVWQPARNSNRGLIVISHGAGGSHLDHRGTASKLVQAGWTVCAPLHSGYNFKDSGKLGSEAYWYDRPREITYAIDAMLTHPKTRHLIDLQRIGAIGFSAGGYSVLGAAGGQPDLAKLNAHCANPTQDARFCAFGEQGLVTHKHFSGKQMDCDERIRAIALVAPVGAVFADGALDSVRSAVLLIRADRDQVLAAPFHAENIHQLLQEDHQYETIEDLHHFGFIEPFPWYLRPFGFEAAKDPNGYKRRENLTRLNAQIVEFLNNNILPAPL